MDSENTAYLAIHKDYSAQSTSLLVSLRCKTCWTLSTMLGPSSKTASGQPTNLLMGHSHQGKRIQKQSFGSGSPCTLLRFLDFLNGADCIPPHRLKTATLEQVDFSSRHICCTDTSIPMTGCTHRHWMDHRSYKGWLMPPQFRYPPPYRGQLKHIPYVPLL